MKVVIINRSDSTGGAAVVSRRLMNALREAGVDASMLVVEKKTDSPHVVEAASHTRALRPFLAERLKIFFHTRFRRENLFKIDTASDGLPLHRHPLVREADVICLGWVNQGMLSLSGLRRLLGTGKPLFWTMHDMWNLTGICHHAGSCTRWNKGCGCCPLLNSVADRDLSASIWNKKNSTYRRAGGRLHFVAVSNWLGSMASASPLLKGCKVSVIPNAFPIPDDCSLTGHEANAMTAIIGKRGENGVFRILMGAARLDDPVKGLPILVEATRVLREKYPAEADRIELVTFGNVKTPGALDGIAVRHRHLGTVCGEDNIRALYYGSDAVISTSLYETLPGTLVEGQVYGCIPVSFGRGGQSDIVDHLDTGYIAAWSDCIGEAAANIADGIVWAMRQSGTEIQRRMLESARARFSASAVAGRYMELFKASLD